LQGDRLVTGFDPSSKAFYHGGDLKGLIAHLDYIQSLGASALWVGPIMKNKPVQGPKARKRRLSRLLDHRFPACRPAFRQR
jgi:glycosidase